MKRLERLTALMSLLQSQHYTTIAQITERFDISERTVFRDLRALEESGVPVTFEEGRGYRVLDRHFLAPMALTLDEAKSFIFAEQLARKYLDADTLKCYLSGLEKVRNRLGDHQLQEVESLASRTLVYIGEGPSPRFLTLVERACTDRLVLKLSYIDAHGRASERNIEPIGITFYSQSWHVVAYCQMRKAYRDFKLARVESLEPTGLVFDTDHITLDQYIQKIQAESSH